jgi:hypothetical protein
MIRVIVIPCVLPFDNRLALPDNSVKEGVQQEDHVVFERINVKQNRLSNLLV